MLFVVPFFRDINRLPEALGICLFPFLIYIQDRSLCVAEALESLDESINGLNGFAIVVWK